MNITVLIATSDGMKYGVSVDYRPSEDREPGCAPDPADITILQIRPSTHATDEIERLVYAEVDEHLRAEDDAFVDSMLDARDDYRRTA